MTGKGKLITVVGLPAAAILIAIVPQFEGMILRGYLDPIGIATKCAGDTTDVVVGQAYTREECQESLERQLVAHAEPVLRCTPGLEGRTYALAAAVSLAYNIGGPAYCKSTVARRLNEGDLAGACAAFSMWTRAGGRELPGLVKRRAVERALCERELEASDGSP